MMSPVPLSPPRPRRAAWTLGLLAAVGILCCSVLSDAVGADNNLGSSPGTSWVVFSVAQHGSQATVSIGPNGGPPANNAQTLFPSGWPSNFSDGGVSFSAAAPCPTTPPDVSQSCTYNVSGSGTVNLYAGNVPQNVPKQPTSFTPPTTTTTAAPTTTTTTTTAPAQPPPDSTFTGPPTGVVTGPGQFTFQSPNASGVTYAWVLQLNGQKVDQANGPSYTPPASIFNVPGEYTLTLVATDGLMHQSFHSVSFQVQGHPQPQPQAQPQAEPTPALPAVSAPSVTKVSNVPQLVNFSTPKPGAVQPVTVIWLWKPDWFQNTGRPKTAGRPTAVKRASVSVDAKGSPSATPWLAGLAVFGIFGGAWLAVRRRRVRTSILD